MTPAQQSALEALAGRALTADQIVQIDALLPARNDVAIAAALSTGRTALFTHLITARGVRQALPVVQAVEFLTLLHDTATAATIPAWLTTVLTQAGVPVEQHFAYFDTIACAHDWLQSDGIDLGSTAARGMLDLIAMNDPPRFTPAVATLKALGQRTDPIQFNDVSRVLNVAEGRMVIS